MMYCILLNQGVLGSLGIESGRPLVLMTGLQSCSFVFWRGGLADLNRV